LAFFTYICSHEEKLDLRQCDLVQEKLVRGKYISSTKAVLDGTIAQAVLEWKVKTAGILGAALVAISGPRLFLVDSSALEAS
jgi:hypothetical protein